MNHVQKLKKYCRANISRRNLKFLWNAVVADLLYWILRFNYSLLNIKTLTSCRRN